MSAYYDLHAFDQAAAVRELAEFRTLLDANTALAEREQVLASFAGWPQLCSMFGHYHPLIKAADLAKRELRIGAHFIADLGVRRSATANVCLIEFEGAKDNCIFSARLKGRRVLPWATAMEKGFSQIVDWAWALDTYRDAPDFQDAFGSRRPNVMAVLVIGRSTSLTDATGKDRWDWRSRSVSLPGIRGVHLQTYDDLYEYFDIQLKVGAGMTIPVAAAPP
ncbi:Shedu anti-phage system protein SduA domain-containing protein [Methylobacterium sp. A54F]